MRAFRHEIATTFNVVLGEIPKAVKDLFDWVYLIQFFTQNEKFREMRGIHKTLANKDISLANVVLINTLYEIESWCTSVLITEPRYGYTMHLRNLDFDGADYFRTITYQAEFKRGDDHLFDAMMFAGNVGVYTGFKEGKFSISENQRWPNENKSGLLANLALDFLGFNEISWSIRNALTNLNTYEDAFAYLKDNKISALGYIILGGPTSGAVISRNRMNAAHIEVLGNGNKFLVQTNNDHWETGCYDRCDVAT